MKLIHKQTGQEVREGDKVTNFRGEPGIVLGWTKPHSPASTGRIFVEQFSGEERHCYPSVYFCEWIDREDRLEEPQPTTVGGFGSSIPSVSTSDQIKQLVRDVEEGLSQVQDALNKIKALFS